LIVVDGILHAIDAGHPVLDGMKNSETPFIEEIKTDHKITEKDDRGHEH
tara:strand:- start:195 stop:341 length:147 start_codon:yes stop_codon:yes gene_type:complete